MRDLEEGATYLVDLCRRHQQLRELVVGLGQVLAEIEADPAAREGQTFASEKLSQLRNELCEHFAHEAGESCTEEAISRLPRISADVRRLRQYQVRLLAELDKLIAAEKHKSSKDISQDFQRMSQCIHWYLSREGAVIAEAFGTDFADQLENIPLKGSCIP